MNDEREQRVALLPPLWILFLLGGTFVAYLVSELREIVVLLVVGYCLAYLINPLLNVLELKKIKRPFGAAIVFSATALFIALLVLTAVPTLFREYEKLSGNFSEYVEIAQGRIAPYLEQAQAFIPAPLRDHLKVVSKKASSVPSIDPNEQQYLSVPEPKIPATIDELPVSSQLLNNVFTALSGTLLSGYSFILILANLALLPFIVYYLAVDFKLLHRNVLALFSPRLRVKVEEIGIEIDSYIAAFVRGQLIVGVILFILYAFGLGILGVDLWFLLALISGFGNMIPYFGFLCGIILSSIMALVTFGDLTSLFQVWGVYVLVQALEGTLITPKVVGDKVGLSPLTVILAIFVGGELFGLLGVFLAVPGAASLKVVGRYLRQWLENRAALTTGDL